jgi:hypothetical protein
MAPHYHEPELFESVALATPEGRLNRAAVGWSRTPLHTCHLTWTDRRPKRWNYWCFTGPEHLVYIAVSDRGLVAVGSVGFLRYRDQRFFDHAVETAPGIEMPETVRGDLRFERPDLTITMTETGPTSTRLEATGTMADGTAVHAVMEVARPSDHETLNVVIPWSDELFQFTSKQECLPVEGFIQVGDEIFRFEPGTAFGTLDYGRGFWPRSSIWNWAAASGVQRGHTIGLNLGGKWTDGTGMNENGYVIDGRLVKIQEDLVWEYDDQDFMKPWRIFAPHSDQIDVRFATLFERRSETGSVELGYDRRVSQVFGHFNGYIRDVDGNRIALVDMFGWAEELTATW